jgi:predicted 2-oxoglutarate/Fe(II)-dependent dioxygenase YbiX
MKFIAVSGRFLTRELCTAFLLELERSAWWQWSQVDSDGHTNVNLAFRRGQWCEVPLRCRRLVAGRVLSIGAGLQRHFGPWHGIEGPNVLRYRAGYFFRAHQDERSGLSRFQHRRRVTIVAFLNDRGFEGGVLRLHGLDGDRPLDVAPRAGSFVAFPSETYHEVTLVRGGERYSLVAWLSS